MREWPAATPARGDPDRARVYRDGRLVARVDGRIFAARDDAGSSLLYDRGTKTVRAMRGGPSWRFDPCPDPNGIHLLELSPDGRHGVCGFIFQHGQRLVLFDARSPARKSIIFRNLSYNQSYRAAWLDDRRIAVAEYRKSCRYYDHYGDGPAGLAIIDLHGRVLGRGPCLAGVLAGPHGLVYVDYFPNFWHFLDAFVDQPRDVVAFSTDRGRSWQAGYPQFADADGHVFSRGTRYIDPVLHAQDDTTVLNDVWEAGWARP